jgi:sulfite dehydrogenase
MLALVVADLSTGNKIGLAVVGGAFIAFALVSSFVLPRRSPNFPGRFMGLYLTVSVLFFIAMLSAVLIFGKEKSEAAGAESQGPPPGKAVFMSAGCGSCHTLKDAGTSGKVGPNLDELQPTEPAIAAQVENGGGVMPAFKDKLSQKQIDDVAKYVFTATHAS